MPKPKINWSKKDNDKGFKKKKNEKKRKKRWRQYVNSEGWFFNSPNGQKDSETGWEFMEFMYLIIIYSRAR